MTLSILGPTFNDLIPMNRSNLGINTSKFETDLFLCLSIN